MGARHSSTSAAYYHNRSLAIGPAAGGDDDGGRQFAQEILQSCDRQLAEQYGVDGYLFPGSGRMMRTFRLRHKKNGSLVVAKLMWVTLDFEDEDHGPEDEQRSDQGSNGSNRGTNPGETIGNKTIKSNDTTSKTGSISTKENRLRELQRELLRVFRALERNSHMAPFLYWKAGPETFRPNYTNNSGTPIPVRPAVLLRPYYYTTLSDRLASRPFLTLVEKLWIVYQLLRALDDLHNSVSSKAVSSSKDEKKDEKIGSKDSRVDSKNDASHGARMRTNATEPIIHGFLTTENVGLSSWNLVVLLDLSASYKGRTALPDDDPSEYLYYFQERQTGSTQNNNSTSANTSDSGNSFQASAQSGVAQQNSSLLSATSASTQPQDSKNYKSNEANIQMNTSRATREKRCYLAPERFYTPGDNRNGDGKDDISGPSSTQKLSSKSISQRLTPAMDIFSAGCVIMETFLNGERAFDLGDLMEYRQRRTYTPALQQKLNKIEFSALRAACKHMLSLNPSERLSAREYLNRLEASGLVPRSFYTLANLTKEVTNANAKSGFNRDSEVDVVTPDARLAKAAACYSEILYETIGIFDHDGKKYFDKVLGRSAITAMRKSSTSSAASEEKQERCHNTSEVMIEGKTEPELDTLFAETNELLRKLETLTLDEDEVISSATKDATVLRRPLDESKKGEQENESTSPNQNKAKRSKLSETSLLIYLQLVLSTVRHVQRPASKLVALQLMKRIGKHTTDEARLQRIVPVAVSLLQDQDPLVRASAIEVLTSTICIVESFPPSDSKVFPQYIFKRVAHLVTDPSLVVRLSFARSVAMLAETAHRFLDISHAVRMYEAVGGGSANGTTGGYHEGVTSHDVFGDDVAKLLGESSSSRIKKENPKMLNRADSNETSSSDILGSQRALISSTYNNDLDALHETVSRWVIHITTDVSEHSSPVKRALLADMGKLCHFFGLDGVMAFILPQILSFLNDRKDWQLRASLFENLQSVCHFIGRAATEHFVLPILETALVDGEEVVISCALCCLSELLSMGLLSRGVFLGKIPSHGTDETPGLIRKYGMLLLHPSMDIRLNVILIINALCKTIGPLDAKVFAVPILRPYLQFQPSIEHLTTSQGLEKCLHPSWNRRNFENELKRIANAMESSPTAGEWTTIALQINDGNSKKPIYDNDASKAKNKLNKDSLSKKDCTSDDHTVRFRNYLQMLARSKNYGAKMVFKNENLLHDMEHAIEGSLKLTQHLKFPRQDILGVSSATLPEWYGSLLESREGPKETVRETSAIRSVAALGQVYGLSIMDQDATGKIIEDGMTADRAVNILQSDESRSVDAACRGEWGSETSLNPALTDTSILVSKLNALEVPPLPPRLCEEKSSIQKPLHPMRQQAREAGDPRDSQVWKPKIDNVIATSRRASGIGHTAPVIRLAVAHDQSFFVSGSYDGTCRVWESEKAEASNGILESSLAYSMVNSNGDVNRPRVNDLVMVDGSHSVASAGSDGSVHVWRVDLVSSSTNLADANRVKRRVAGSTGIKKVNPSEGEVLAVNQFNNQGSSLIAYGTEKGHIHSWDLRSAKEPFCLKNFQDIGYITNMAIGSDRNWVVVGTHKGFISLWDLRFHQIMKLWQHSRSTPINRLATSFVPPPQSWIGKRSTNFDSKPYIFIASGSNECSMFDATTGHCSECFRTVEYKNKSASSRVDGIPSLKDVPLSPSLRRKTLCSQGYGFTRLPNAISSTFQSVNCMVGSTGNSDHSFLITGGSDRRIRFWDFSIPSKCYATNGLDPIQPRPRFERIDYDNDSRLMLCHQAPSPAPNEVDSSRLPRKLFQGTRAMPQGHSDSICDLKFLKHSLLSCSRDCTIKVWR